MVSFYSRNSGREDDNEQCTNTLVFTGSPSTNASTQRDKHPDCPPGSQATEMLADVVNSNTSEGVFPTATNGARRVSFIFHLHGANKQTNQPTQVTAFHCTRGQTGNRSSLRRVEALLHVVKRCSRLTLLSSGKPRLAAAVPRGCRHGWELACI